MRRLRHRIVRSRLSVVWMCVAPVCLAIALAGCATSSAADRNAAAPAAAKAARGATGATASSPSPAAQPQTERRQIDEPSELYSPLYGYGLWASYRPFGTRPWSAAQEDAIIAQAITAHEMRRP